MTKTLLALPLLLVLAACGTTVEGSTVTVTAPAPVTVTAEPEPSESLPDTSEDIVIEVAVRSVWNDLSATEKGRICDLYEVAPDVAEESFREGFGEEADVAWPILARIMKDEC